MGPIALGGCSNILPLVLVKPNLHLLIKLKLQFSISAGLNVLFLNNDSVNLSNIKSKIYKYTIKHVIALCELCVMDG